MEHLKQDAAALAEYLVGMRRQLHMHPEICFEEYATAALIEAELDKLDIPHERLGPTGVYAVLKGGAGEGRCVLLRADMDALPMTETAEAPYRSQNPGRMHACGHDAHVACLLGAARLLKDRLAEFAGEVRLVFQPAEEVGGGTGPFLAAGVLDGVYRSFGLHCAPDVPCGTVGLKPGLNNASVDHFTVRIHGRAAHVSTPQLGCDALYIASQLVVALQALVTRMSSPVEPLLLGIGKLNAGEAYNIVAKQAVLEGTTRCVTHEARARIRQQIDATAAAIAAVYGGTAECEWEDFAPPVINDAAATAEAAALVRQHWGESAVTADRAISLGGDNFADFQTVPGVYGYLGTGCADNPATCLPLHNGGFDLDERALPFGAALYAAAALHWLG